MTSTASVKVEDTDKTTGPTIGVDDHTTKLPNFSESVVRAKVPSCRVNHKIIGKVDDAPHTGLAVTDKWSYGAIVEGSETKSIVWEPETPHPSVKNCGCAHVLEETPEKARNEFGEGLNKIATAYTSNTCEKSEVVSLGELAT